MKSLEQLAADWHLEYKKRSGTIAPAALHSGAFEEFVRGRMSCFVCVEYRDRSAFTCWLNLKMILGYMCAAMKLNQFPPQDIQVDDNQNTVWKWWAVFPCLCHPELREHDWWVKCEFAAELHYIIIIKVQVKNHFHYQWEVAVFAYKNCLGGSFTAHHHFKFMFSSVTRRLFAKRDMHSFGSVCCCSHLDQSGTPDGETSPSSVA